MYIMIFAETYIFWLPIPGSVQERKGMGAIFKKKGKEMFKGKIFANLGKNV